MLNWMKLYFLIIQSPISSKAYRVFNKRTLLVEESVLVVFDESNDIISQNIVSNDIVKKKPSMESIYIKENEENPLREHEEEMTMEKLQETYALPKRDSNLQKE